MQLQTKKNNEKNLGSLAGLAIQAGFDWVEYTTSEYIRASVIPDGKCSIFNQIIGGKFYWYVVSSCRLLGLKAGMSKIFPAQCSIFLSPSSAPVLTCPSIC